VDDLSAPGHECDYTGDLVVADVSLNSWANPRQTLRRHPYTLWTDHCRLLSQNEPITELDSSSHNDRLLIAHRDIRLLNA
jgi:hypothetical protein